MPADFAAPPALPGWLEEQLPFRRGVVTTSAGRIHVIDEGEGPAVLLMHGNPMWSYLYRKVIPPLLQGGCRVIVPDLLGFGLSGKPSDPAAHRLSHHIDVMVEVVQQLAPSSLVLMGQDWGGPIASGVGLRAGIPVEGLVFANTAVLEPARPFRSKPFHRFSHMPLVSDVVFRGLGFPLQALDRVQGQGKSISRREKRAYRYPFRKLQDRAGPLGLARMVPDSESHPSTAMMDEIGAFLRSLNVPTALVWGRQDPILGRALRRHREAFPHARVIETAAGHFLQEEVPDLLAEVILDVVRARAARAA